MIKMTLGEMELMKKGYFKKQKEWCENNGYTWSKDDETKSTSG